MQGCEALAPIFNFFVPVLSPRLIRSASLRLHAPIGSRLRFLHDYRAAEQHSREVFVPLRVKGIAQAVPNAARTCLPWPWLFEMGRRWRGCYWPA